MLCLKYQSAGDTRAHESWSVMWRSVWPGFGGFLGWFGWGFFSVHICGAVFYPPVQFLCGDQSETNKLSLATL
uniref:Uncharacterized protein n=1 Tax=Setaria italica TaxID=4555 RepID=K3Z1Y0_SETIT